MASAALWFDRLVLACLVAPYLALAWPGLAARLGAWRARPAIPLGLAAALVLLLIVNAAVGGKASPGELIILALVASLALATAVAQADSPALPIWRLFPVLILWLPVELGTPPELPLQLTPGLALPGGLFLMIDLGLLIYLVLRPLPGIGFDFRLTPSDWRTIGTALLAYAAIALPLGASLSFLAFGLDADLVAKALPMALAIFWLNALPEELLFRGVLQNWLERRSSGAVALLLAAAIFGFAHLNNPTALHPAVPNWPYVLMASLAGLAYGWTWWRTRKITCSAIVHALVNLTWLSFLDGGA